MKSYYCVTLILHCKWRYVGARINPCQNKKKCFFCTSFYIIFWKNKYFEKLHHFCTFN